MPRSRPPLIATLALTAALALGSAGCGTAPSTAVPSRPAATATPGPTEIAGRITSEDLGATLDALAAIAATNDGTRRTGSAGDAATAAYVATTLAALGYRVEEPSFETPVFVDGTTDALEVLGPNGRVFVAGRDFGPLMFSGAGQVTGPVVDLDWDGGATTPDGRGCAAADFEGLEAGAVVLVRPGPCSRGTVVQRAAGAGAGAVVSAIPWRAPGEIVRSTLLDEVSIPSMAADHDVGDALAAAATTGALVRVVSSGSTEKRAVRSVIGELEGADPSRVVIIGAHLDSSMDGPGIDDDGSGIAAVLAVARALAGTSPAVTVRFAFWAAEESGLRGSTHYAWDHSSSSERMVAYLNVDMIASPNGFPVVYDDAAAAPGSDRIRDLFTADLSAAGLAWETMDLSDGADHMAFARAGVPTGGLFTGASEIVTEAQAATFGRTAGLAADRCYHLACDGRGNVDPDLMLSLARSLARVAVVLIRG